MRKRTYAYILLMGSLAALLGLYILFAGLVLPFGGYTIHGYKSIPPVVCPGETLQLSTDVEFAPPRYARLGSYRLVTYWVNTQGTRTEGETFRGSFADSQAGRRFVLSPVLRTAPPTEGDWKLVSNVYYEGTVLRARRSAEAMYTTPEPVLRTLPLEATECRLQP